MIHHMPKQASSTSSPPYQIIYNIYIPGKCIGYWENINMNQRTGAAPVVPYPVMLCFCLFLSHRACYGIFTRSSIEIYLRSTGRVSHRKKWEKIASGIASPILHHVLFFFWACLMCWPFLIHVFPPWNSLHLLLRSGCACMLADLLGHEKVRESRLTAPRGPQDALHIGVCGLFLT